MWASRPRRNSSFLTSVFTAAAEASVGPVFNHRSREVPISGSVTSRASNSARRASVSRCANLSEVSRTAAARAAATRSSNVTTPGRTTFELRRCSQANRNSSDGESCSIARASRNSSSSLPASIPAVCHPAYRNTSRR